MPSATGLPSDPDALRAFALALHEELALKDRELHAKTLHIEKADQIVRLRPGSGKALASVWAEVVKPRLRPVLWEIGLASVVLNILALVT